MDFDLDGARQAGASDDDIAGFLAEKHGFDLEGALKAGASTSQVAEFLASNPSPRPAPVQVQPSPQDSIASRTMKYLGGRVPEYWGQAFEGMDLQRSAAGGLANLSTAIQDTNQAVFAEADKRAKAKLESGEWDQATYNSYLARFGAARSASSEESLIRQKTSGLIAEESEAAMPKNLSLPQKAVRGAVESMAAQAPATVWQAASKNPVALAYMGSQTFLDSRAEAKRQGLGEAEADKKAAIDSAAEMIGEWFPGKVLGRVFKSSNPREVAEYLVGEQVGEQFTSFAQLANDIQHGTGIGADWGQMTPEQKAEYIQNMSAETAATTLVQSTAQGLGVAGAGKLADKALGGQQKAGDGAQQAGQEPKPTAPSPAVIEPQKPSESQKTERLSAIKEKLLLGSDLTSEEEAEFLDSPDQIALASIQPTEQEAAHIEELKTKAKAKKDQADLKAAKAAQAKAEKAFDDAFLKGEESPEYKAALEQVLVAKRKLAALEASQRPVEQPKKEPVQGQKAEVKVVGSTGTEKVSTPKGTSADTEYVVSDADSILASNDEGYPSEFQPRKRKDSAASDAQIKSIIDNFDPNQLGSSSVASFGAPITASRGGRDVMISGNGRTMALRKIFKTKPDLQQKYIDYWAERGLTIKPGQIVHRRLTSEMNDDQLRKFAVESNEPVIASMTAAERAKSDQDLLTSDVLSRLEPDEITSTANEGFIKSFMKGVSANRMKDFVADDGKTLTSEGVRRIQNAILAKAYGGSTFSDAVIDRATISTADNIKTITGAMMDAAADIADLRQMISEGRVAKDKDITKDLVVAIETISGAKDRKKNINDVVNNQELLADDAVSDVAKEIIREFYQADDRGNLTRMAGRRQIANFIREFADKAKAAREDQGSMFGDEPLSLIDIVKASRRDAAGRDDQPNLFRRKGGLDKNKGKEQSEDGQSPIGGKDEKPIPPGHYRNERGVVVRRRAPRQYTPEEQKRIDALRRKREAKIPARKRKQMQGAATIRGGSSGVTSGAARNQQPGSSGAAQAQTPRRLPRRRVPPKRFGPVTSLLDRLGILDANRVPAPFYRFSKKSPIGFYSELLDAAEKLKQEKGTPDQMLAMLVKAGAKQKEIDATGLFDYLKLQGKSVTKQQIVDYLRGNGVQVEEALLYGEGDVDGDARDDAIQEAVERDIGEYSFDEDDDGFWRITDPNGDRVLDRDAGFLRFDSEDAARDHIAYILEDDYRQMPDAELLERLGAEPSDVSADGPAKFSYFVLPGGENYKELLLTLPQKHSNGWPGKELFRSSHFDESNILAHVRFDERVDADGKRVLMLQELQGDWPQKGRQLGFNKPLSESDKKELAILEQENSNVFEELKLAAKAASGPKDEEFDRLNKKHKDLLAKIQEIRDREVTTGVPLAPFVTSTDAWVSLLLKRMITYAVENGFDRVAWTTGEQQAERYDLSKHVEAIDAEADHVDGVIYVDIRAARDRDIYLEVRNGVVSGGLYGGRNLEDVVGKDIASQILELKDGNVKSFSGPDLKIGGEGMKAFYDSIVPKAAEKIIKKMGGKVASIEIPWRKPDGSLSERRDPLRQPGFDITPQMREQVENVGLPLFKKKAAESGKKATVAEIYRELEKTAPALVGHVKVVQSPRDLPKGHLDYFSRIGQPLSKIDGYYTKGKNNEIGTAYVVADNVDDLDAAIRAVLHEAAGHKALHLFLGNSGESLFRRVFASPEFKDLRDSVESKYKAEKAEARRDGTMREYEAWMGEEILAELSELDVSKMTVPQRTAFQKFVDAIRKLVGKVFGQHYTREEAVILLKSARAMLEADYHKPRNAKEAANYIAEERTISGGQESFDFSNIASSDAEATKADAADNFYQQTKSVATREFRSQVKEILTEEDAATFARDAIGNMADEVALLVLVGKGGKIIETNYLSKGTLDSASVYPGRLASWAASADGVETVVFAHNHPTGVAEPSQADYRVSGAIDNAIRLIGIKHRIHLVVGDDQAAIFEADNYTKVPGEPSRGQGVFIVGYLKPSEKTKKHWISERVIIKRPSSKEVDRRSLTSPAAARDFSKKAFPGDRSGIVLLDNRHRVNGTITLTKEEAADILSGGENPTISKRILKAIADSNSAAIIFVANGSDNSGARGAAGFFTEFSTRTDIRSLDVLFWNPDGSHFSAAEKGLMEAGGEYRLSKKDQTKTPEFKKWFGDSKLKDKDGSPWVVFHGSDKSFDEFKLGGRNPELSFRDGVNNFGFHFTTSEDDAKIYAGNGEVRGFYLKAENPLDFQGRSEFTKQQFKAFMLSNGVDLDIDTDHAKGSVFHPYELLESIAGVKDGLLASGYDAVIYNEGSAKTVVVFSPTQIKSATGNRGTFDPENPDIRFARKGFELDAKDSKLYKTRTRQDVKFIPEEITDKALQTDAVARKILAKGKKPKAGDLVGVRLNINVLKSTGVPVQTVHAGTPGILQKIRNLPKEGRGFYNGEVITYQNAVTVKEAFMDVNQKAREGIASGATSKTPMGSVDGLYVDTRDHSFDGVEFRFNPHREHLFVDRYGRALRYADEATIMGNSVFARGKIEYFDPDTMPEKAGTAASKAVMFDPDRSTDDMPALFSRKNDTGDLFGTGDGSIDDMFGGPPEAQAELREKIKEAKSKVGTHEEQPDMFGGDPDAPTEPAILRRVRQNESATGTEEETADMFGGITAADVEKSGQYSAFVERQKREQTWEQRMAAPKPQKKETAKKSDTADMFGESYDMAGEAEIERHLDREVARFKAAYPGWNDSMEYMADQYRDAYLVGLYWSALSGDSFINKRFISEDARSAVKTGVRFGMDDSSDLPDADMDMIADAYHRLTNKYYDWAGERPKRLDSDIVDKDGRTFKDADYAYRAAWKINISNPKFVSTHKPVRVQDGWVIRKIDDSEKLDDAQAAIDKKTFDARSGAAAIHHDWFLSAISQSGYSTALGAAPVYSDKEFGVYIYQGYGENKAHISAYRLAKNGEIILISGLKDSLDRLKAKDRKKRDDAFESFGTRRIIRLARRIYDKILSKEISLRAAIGKYDIVPNKDDKGRIYYTIMSDGKNLNYSEMPPRSDSNISYRIENKKPHKGEQFPELEAEFYTFSDALYAARSLNNDPGYTRSGDDLPDMLSRKKSDAVMAEVIPRFDDDKIGKIKRRIKSGFKRWLTKEGGLPDDFFKAKVEGAGMNSRLIDVEARYHAARFRGAIQKAYGKKYSSLTDQEKAEINKALIGEPARIPAEAAMAVQGMRDILDAVSEDLIASQREMISVAMEGRDPVERLAFLEWIQAGADPMAADGVPADVVRQVMLMQKISSNRGQYLNRSYQAFDDPKWMDKVMENRQIINAAVRFLEANGDRDAMGTIKRILATAKHKADPLEFTDAAGKQLGIFKRRKDIPAEIRALLGEYKEPLLNFERSLSKMSNIVSSHHALMSMRESGLASGILSKKPTEDRFIQIQGGERLSPVSGLYAEPEVAQAIEDYTTKEVVGNFIRFMGWFNSLVKTGKTVWSPKTQARNLFSNVALAVANGHINPAYLAEAIKLGVDETYRPAAMDRAFIGKLAERGVLHNAAINQELQAQIKDALAGGEPKGLAKILGVIGDVAQATYGLSDNIWKINGYLHELDRAKDRGLEGDAAEAHAAERVINTYPSYHMIPRAMDRLRRLPIGPSFLAWPWEILRTTGHQAAYIAMDTKEGHYSEAATRAVGNLAATAFFIGLAKASLSSLGMDDDDDEALRAAQPPFRKNSTIAYYRDENGDLKATDLSAYDPRANITKVVRAAMGSNDGAIWEAIKEALSPFLGVQIGTKALIEAFNGYDSMGRPIYNKDADTDAEIAEKAMVHIAQGVEPGLGSMLEAYYRSGAESINPIAEKLGWTWAMTDQTTRSGRKYTAEDANLQWLGFTSFTAEPRGVAESLAYRYEKARIEASMELTKAFTTGATLQPSAAKKAVLDYKSAMGRARKPVRDFGNTMMRGGLMTNSELMMGLTGVIGKSEAGNLMAGGRITVSPERIKNIAERAFDRMVKSGMSKADASKEVSRRIRMLTDELGKE